MKIDFSDRRVLVTGSSSGIGFAAAKEFAAAGAGVVVNGRTQASVDAAVARLEAGCDVEGFAGDLGSASACARLIDRSNANRRGRGHPSGTSCASSPSPSA